MFRAKNFKGVVKSLASIPLSLPFLLTHAGFKKIEKNISQAGVYKSIFREEILEDLESSENIIQLAYAVMVAGIVNLIPVGIPTLLGGVEYAFDNTIVKDVKKIIEKINGKKPKSFLESLDKCIEKIDIYETKKDKQNEYSQY